MDAYQALGYLAEKCPSVFKPIKDEMEKSKETAIMVIQELAQEKLKNIQKDSVITELTKQLTTIKLDLIKMKGSAE